MKIAVIGTGYVGLVAGTCFSETGNEVVCVDINKEKIEALNRIKIPIYEPGLEDLIKQNKEKKRLFFSTDIEQAIKKSHIIFIAVGTPPGEDGTADLKHVLGVAKTIGENLNNYKLIVNKSTVPIGTGEKVENLIKSISTTPFEVVSNPEFLKEGTAVSDFLKPDRVIIGTKCGKAWKLMKQLYSPFVRNLNPIIRMEVKSAEMTKYACNAMLATRISFMNEMANLCELVGANISEMRLGMQSDPRIGKEFLYPGIGYGGSCFPKDIKAIISTAKQFDLEFGLLKQVERVNEKQKTLLVSKIKKHFGDKLEGFSFGVWGLSFKPKTDDIREAPAMVIIDNLLSLGASLRVHDPKATEEVKKIFTQNKNIEFFTDHYQLLKGVDALVLCTEWNEYKLVDFEKMKVLMKNSVLFDGRNIWVNAPIENQFQWYGIGYTKKTFN